MLQIRIQVKFYFRTLNLYGKRVIYSYHVTSFNGESTRLLIRKCIVFSACDDMKVKIYVMYLLAAIRVVQNFIVLIYMTVFIPNFFYVFGVVQLIFVYSEAYSSPQLPLSTSLDSSRPSLRSSLTSYF